MKHRKQRPNLDSELQRAEQEREAAEDSLNEVRQQRAEFTPMAERAARGLAENRFGLLMARAIAARRAT